MHFDSIQQILTEYCYVLGTILGIEKKARSKKNKQNKQHGFFFQGVHRLLLEKYTKLLYDFKGFLRMVCTEHYRNTEEAIQSALGGR